MSDDAKDEEYTYRQIAREAEYRAAWAALSPAMQARLAARGIVGPDTSHLDDAPQEGRVVVGRDADAGVLAERRLAIAPDVAGDLDTAADVLVEEYGLAPEQGERVAGLIARLVRNAQAQVQARLLHRIVGFLILSTENDRARVHALVHACRMSERAHFPSLRASARACGCSPEWMSRVTRKWCEVLGLPPIENAKSDQARRSYQADALKPHHHWRKKKWRKPPPQLPPSPNAHPPA